MGTDSLRGALVGAVWAGVMMWLMSLLAVAAWAVSQRFHPLVFAYSLVGVPVLVVIAALPGAVGGYVLAARTGRKGLTPTPPRPILRLLRPALLIMAAGTAVIVAATMTRAVNEHRPIARLASVGGRVDFPGRVVSFPDGRLSYAQLPFVVECLNECRPTIWFVQGLRRFSRRVDR